MSGGGGGGEAMGRIGDLYGKDDVINARYHLIDVNVNIDIDRACIEKRVRECAQGVVVVEDISPCKHCRILKRF